MLTLKGIICVFFLIKVIYGLNFILGNFTQCGDPMIYVNIDCKTVNDDQICHVIHRSPVDDGENFRFQLNIDFLRGKKWRTLIDVKEEKGLCRAMEIYIRSVFYDAMEIVGRPKQCPLRKGTVDVKQLRVDLKKMQIPLPKGHLKFHIKSYEKATGKLGVCFELEVHGI